MIRCSIRDLASIGAVAIISAAFLLPDLDLSGVSSVTAWAAGTPSASDACALLTPADIAKATGLKVGNGAAGKPIPGILGRCTWLGDGNTKVIVTLGDAQHIGLTVAAAEQNGGESVPGLGTKAVGTKGAAFSGGGYIINVLDSKGGFGVSILGKEGTRDRAITLAKIVESRR